jgi:D-amino-acid dehydrogenase
MKPPNASRTQPAVPDSLHSERSLPTHLPDAGRLRGGDRPSSIVLVGAGAVNLVTAWWLQRAGFHLTVIDARPDPRTSAVWRSFGCTFGGYGARIFTLTEARQHHRRDDSEVRERSAYRRPFSEAGWLFCPVESLTPADWAWIEAHERVTGSALRRYGEDIESFNVESLPLWDAMREEEPGVFQQASYHEPVTRTYPTESGVEAGAKHEASLSAEPKRLSREELKRRIPALAEAVASGEIAGALEVKGFSLNVHVFGTALIDSLAKRGVKFVWNTEVERLRMAADGTVEGLDAQGSQVVADAYVLSPGIYGGKLLNGTKSAPLLAAVAGGWIAVPNPEPALDIGLKISRRGFAAPGAAEGANVIPGFDQHGRPQIRISSGHGFLGQRPDNLAGADIGRLNEAARQTADRYFPDRPAASFDELRASERYCIRPWTPTGLGLFETMPATGGGVLIIAAGHNTGGFAQAPAIAQAVLAAMRGEPHRMHSLYHPGRGIDMPNDANHAVGS